MSEPLSDPRELEQKKTYLDLLAIGHYIVGGLTALAVAFALVMFAFMGFAPLVAEGADGAAASVFMMMAFGGVLLFGGGYTVLNLMTARSLQTRQRHTLCMVTSVINCFNTPLGTVLGILTIVVLANLEVKAMFGSAPPPPPSTTAPVAPPATA